MISPPRMSSFRALVAIALILAAMAARGAEIRGSVTAVDGGGVSIELDGRDQFPHEGDSVVILAAGPNGGDAPRRGTWRVASVSRKSTVAEIVGTGDVTAVVGDTVKIDSPSPQSALDLAFAKRLADVAKQSPSDEDEPVLEDDSGSPLEGRVTRVTATGVEIEIAGEPLRAGDKVEIFKIPEAGGWAQSFANVRTSVSGTAASQPRAPTAAITPRIESAFQAYSRCDYNVALAHLGSAEAQRAGDSRTATMRSLVDRQMRAESLLVAASAGVGDLALAQQAYAAASPPAVSPPCQMRRIRNLITSLENVELTALGESSRQRAREREAKWDRIYDTFATEAIGLLGEVNSLASGQPAPPLPPLDSLGTSRFPSSTRTNCIVQAQGDTSGETFLVGVPSTGANDLFYVWTMDALKAQSGGVSCDSAHDCLLKLLPNTAMRILGSFANPALARQAAQARCSR